MAIGSNTADGHVYNLFEASNSQLYQFGSTKAEHASSLTAKMLSEVWLIDQAMAQCILEQTTQLHRKGESSLACHFWTNDQMLLYR